ncbi:MAG: hypothetical protein ACI86M_003953 [Saprospiraceae bacterium]
MPNQDIDYNSRGLGIDKRNIIKKTSRSVDVSIAYFDSEVAPWYQTSNNAQYFINFSCLGNQRLALEKSKVGTTKHFRNGVKPKFEKIPFDANKLILAKAKKSKILIINEAHTRPSHRAYISNLLPDLKKMGYTKLAMEALKSDNIEHSLTIKDPTFLRCLVVAKGLGYHLISYDNKSTNEPDWVKRIKPMDGIEFTAGYENIGRDMNIRDYNQFLNIDEKIDHLAENEKIIIYVGYGHGITQQNGGWKPLGAYLIEKYGHAAILSIDQVSLNNCISIDSNDYYNQYKPKK